MSSNITFEALAGDDTRLLSAARRTLRPATAPAGASASAQATRRVAFEDAKMAANEWREQVSMEKQAKQLVLRPDRRQRRHRASAVGFGSDDDGTAEDVSTVRGALFVF